jgi:hypothetical protein
MPFKLVFVKVTPGPLMPLPWLLNSIYVMYSVLVFNKHYHNRIATFFCILLKTVKWKRTLHISRHLVANRVDMCFPYIFTGKVGVACSLGSKRCSMLTGEVVTSPDGCKRCSILKLERYLCGKTTWM